MPENVSMQPLSRYTGGWYQYFIRFSVEKTSSAKLIEFSLKQNKLHEFDKVAGNVPGMATGISLSIFPQCGYWDPQTDSMACSKIVRPWLTSS
jgi:hypothetical protein